ncbi:MAG: hypothetical protein K5869_07460 [Saccharofermentans sp.]|nr:hypothetical protein [Saccharofermentans sp.]
MKSEFTKITVKIAAIGLVGVMANVGLVACSRNPGSSNADTATEINIVDISNDEIDRAAVAGGWQTAEDQTITDAQKAIFDKAMEKLVGVKYEPVAYLASQVVSGTNHCFLAKATVVRPGATPRYTLVYIYEDLKKDCKILNIEDVALPGARDGKAPLGGFTFAENPAITPDIAAIMDKASASKLGANYEPVANIGSQVINGTNHVILCKVTAVSPNSTCKYALVQVMETIDGKCTISEVTDIVLSANK